MTVQSITITMMLSVKRLRFFGWSSQLFIRMFQISKDFMERIVHYNVVIRGVNFGGLGSRPPDFGQWGRRGVAGGRGGRGLVVKYYYILSCTGSMFESVDF